MFQELNLFRDIRWKNGVPPLDQPECGFQGELCTKDESFGKHL